MLLTIKYIYKYSFGSPIVLSNDVPNPINQPSTCIELSPPLLHNLIIHRRSGFYRSRSITLCVNTLGRKAIHFPDGWKPIEACNTWGNVICYCIDTDSYMNVCLHRYDNL